MFKTAAAPATDKSIHQAAAKGGNTFSDAVLKSSRMFKKPNEVIYDRLHMGLSRRAQDGKKSQERKNATASTERRHRAGSVDGWSGAGTFSPINSQRNIFSTATRRKEKEQNIEIIGGRLSPQPRMYKSKATVEEPPSNNNEINTKLKEQPFNKQG